MKNYNIHIIEKIFKIMCSALSMITASCCFLENKITLGIIWVFSSLLWIIMTTIDSDVS